MSEQQHVRADGTVTFLPHRLNRHPVVVRGLTADELWICCGLSGAAGLLVGAPLSWVFRTIAMAPTFVVLGVAWASSSAAASCAASSAAPRHLAVPATAMAHRHAPSADGGLGGRPCADLALGLLVHPQGTMSRFKNEIAHLQAHIKTLAPGRGALVIVALVMGGGWWSAPRDLTIHVPPDLRSGSTRKWWEVPPESVYAFTFYVFQTLNRWPTNGEEDYSRNLHALAVPHPVLPGLPARGLRLPPLHGRAAPARARHLRDSRPRLWRRPHGARAHRVRPRLGGDAGHHGDEYYGAEQVKRALVRYPIKVTRVDVDPARNPFGLALDCYDGAPQRISAPEPTRPAPSGLSPQAPQGGNTP
jgi:hypothetical protein